jgi:sugar O-acyltransferase (sialic acid O-acetyltransferase NeuD family)
MSKNNLLIIGAGGHGRVIAETAEASGKWERIAFLDDKFPSLKFCEKWPVIGKIDEVDRTKGDYVSAAVGIGDNALRLKFIHQLLELGFNLPVIVHPSAVVSQYSKVEAGTVMFALSSMNIGSKLGLGCIVNTGVRIDHDCIIGDGVHLSPGVSLAGGVNVGDMSWVGIGATIIQGITVGEKVIIGAGSVVIRDLPNSVKAFGVPAKIKEKK